MLRWTLCTLSGDIGTPAPRRRASTGGLFMPEFLARLTRFTIPLKGEYEALPTEANREPAEVLAEQLRPTHLAGLGWPTLRSVA